MEKMKAQSVALLSYIDPVVALILSSLILKEKMTKFGLIGAVILISSLIISELIDLYENKNKMKKEK